MSFVIDESKVEELRKASQPLAVSIAPGGDPAPSTENCAPLCYDSMAIAGTVAFAPVGASREAREYLMILRRNIEKSGASLKNAQALGEEIDRMRRR